MTVMVQIWVEEVLGSYARWKGRNNPTLRQHWRSLSISQHLSTSLNISQHLSTSLNISQHLSLYVGKGPCSSKH